MLINSYVAIDDKNQRCLINEEYIVSIRETNGRGYDCGLHYEIKTTDGALFSSLPTKELTKLFEENFKK